MTRCQKSDMLTSCQKGEQMQHIMHSDERKSDKHRSEIVRACRELYQHMSFKEITIKEISKYTSFSRPSIYNYFPTRESIFLDIFREEYALWCNDMDNILANYKQLTTKQFADKMAVTLEARPVLLKLLSMNLYDLEENCTLADLTNFKKEYGRALDTVRRMLKTYFKNMTKNDIEQFIYTFFPFMFGLYPYAHATQKQKDAMQAAGIKNPEYGIYDFANKAILTFLNSLTNK